VPIAFPVVNCFCMVLLCGRAGCLTWPKIDVPGPGGQGADYLAHRVSCELASSPDFGATWVRVALEPRAVIRRISDAALNIIGGSPIFHTTAVVESVRGDSE
jgi:hypothetical protein